RALRNRILRTPTRPQLRRQQLSLEPRCRVLDDANFSLAQQECEVGGRIPCERERRELWRVGSHGECAGECSWVEGLESEYFWGADVVGCVLDGVDCSCVVQDVFELASQL
ncbi:hypothetical protein HDU98_006010, partial [Podochytrium sp. JEL0797]